MRFNASIDERRNAEAQRKELFGFVSPTSLFSPRLLSSAPLRLALVMLSLAATGCGTPSKGKPLAKEFAGNKPDEQIAFWHQLTDDPVASNDQAFHALLLYGEGKDDCTDYAARVDSLKKRKMLPPDFSQPADAAVTCGTLAVAILRIIKDPGGATIRVFGPRERYAVRELVWLEVLPPSTPNQALSGNELVGIIGKVEDFQRGNPADFPAEVLPGEMDLTAANRSQAIKE